MRYVGLLGLVLSAACGPSASERAEQALRNLYARTLTDVVAVDCASKRPEQTKCGLIAKQEGWGTPEHFARFTEISECDSSTEECRTSYAEKFHRLLGYRYSGARPTQVQEKCEEWKICSAYEGLELAYLSAHNTATYAAYDRESRQIQTTFREELAEERAAADSRRRAAAAIGAGLQAFGRGMQQSHQPAHTRNYSTPSASGCASDYACGYGMSCVKAAGAYTGFCARAVTPAGVPTFDPPNPDSVGAGDLQCRFDTQCTVGFRCVSNHCVRGAP